MAATYRINPQAVTFASGKSLADVLQTVSGTKTILGYRFHTANIQTAAVTGVMTTNDVRAGITAVSGGSAATILQHKSSDTAPGANISAGTGRTITGGTVYRRILWSNDEPAVSASTIDEWECLIPNTEIFNSGYGDSNVEPLACIPATAQGFDIHQAGASAVGTVDCEIEMTIV
jgi:hypothetical protein